MIQNPRPVVEVACNHPCVLGEGPVWDAKTQTICWVDILRGDIHQFAVSRKTHHVINVEHMVGAIALCRDGNFIAALKKGIAFVHRETGRVTIVKNPEAHLPGNRFNDGKCDPSQRFWVGTMALSEAPAAGNLYMIDKDLSVNLKIGRVSISNGMAWSNDRRKFYYIDTPTREVAVFDYDDDTGSISNKGTALKISEDDGFPDAMTIDNEGMLWISHWDGWQVTRWDPAAGQKLLSIRLPVARVTSCTFGGGDFRDLYITSAKVGLNEKQLEEQPLAGSLFVIRNSGFQGLEAFEFDHHLPVDNN